MGKIWMPPSGGGADLDVVTATENDVLSGKVIINKDGDPITGKIPLRGATTITPGTANQVIAAEQYLSGTQTVTGDPNLRPENIKKGITLFGKVGTWQGYVDSPLYLYNKGVWSNLQITGVTGSRIEEYNNAIRIESSFGNTYGGRLNQSVNLSPYKYINMSVAGSATEFTMGVSSSTSISSLNSLDTKTASTAFGAVKLDISSISGDKFIYMFARSDGSNLFSANVSIIFLSTN